MAIPRIENSFGARVLILLLMSFHLSTVHAEPNVYKYEDDSGVIHYVDTLDKIPEKYREEVTGPHVLPHIARGESKRADNSSGEHSFRAGQLLRSFGELDSRNLSYILVISALVMSVYFVGMWILLERASMHGYGLLIPFYNLLLLTRLGGKSGWWLCWWCVPPILGGAVWWLTVHYGVAKNFRRGNLFAFGTMLCPFLFIPIMAFGKE